MRAAAWRGQTLHPTGVPLAGLSTPLPSRRLLGTHRLLSFWSRGQAGTVTCLDGEPPGLWCFLGAHVRALDVADEGEGAVSWQHRAWLLRSPSPHGRLPGDRRGWVLPCRRAGGAACSGSSCPGWLDVPSSDTRLRGSSRRSWHRARPLPALGVPVLEVRDDTEQRNVPSTPALNPLLPPPSLLWGKRGRDTEGQKEGEDVWPAPHPLHSSPREPPYSRCPLSGRSSTALSPLPGRVVTHFDAHPSPLIHAASAAS